MSALSTSTPVAEVATPRRARRGGLLALIALTVAFLLSGCMKFTTDLSVDEDLNVSGEIVFGIETSALEAMGATAEDISGGEPTDLPEGATYEPLDDGTYSGFVLGMNEVPASEFASDQAMGGTAPGMTLTEQDGVITFAMPSPLADLEEESSGSEMPFDAASMVDEAWVEITFPGSVTEAEGAEIDGNTARWDLTEYTAAELNATAEMGGGNLVLTLVLIIVVVLLAAAVAFVIVRRRRGSAAPVTAEATAAPAAFAAPGAAATAAPVWHDATDAPAEPEATDAPAEPEATDAPAEPEATDAPAEPEATDAPAEPEAPEDDRPNTSGPTA